MCANISYYNDSGKASFFTSQIEEILHPVHQFVSNWINDYLNSTWPEIEMILIENIMKEVSKGSVFPETNDTYERLVDSIYMQMEGIGHPR